MSQRAQATGQVSASIEDLMARRENIQRMIDTLENRLDHTEQDAVQGLLDLSQSGSGVSGPPMGAMAQVMPVHNPPQIGPFHADSDVWVIRPLAYSNL